MRNLFVVLMIMSFSQVFACDGCNISTGIVNSDPVNYISIRHRNLYYVGEEIPFMRHTGHGGQLSEKYLSYDIIAKYFFSNKAYLQSIISTSEIDIVSFDLNRKVSGFADPIFLFGYQSFEIYKKWQLNYNLFGGFDLGVGEYNNSLHQEYSPGSKTTDVLVGTELMGRFLKWGVISRLNYKNGFENSENYQFGQVINSSLHTGYYHERGNLMYVPLFGVSFESDFTDYYEGKSVKYSSSKVLFGDLGVNILFSKKLIFGGKYQFTLIRDVPGWSKLKVDAFELEISYVLGK